MPDPYYTAGGVTLYCGDMRDVVPALGEPFDAVVTDPPYEETSLEWDRWPTGWLDVVAQVSSSMWCFLPLRQFVAPALRGCEFDTAGWKLSHDVEAEWDHVVWEKHNGSSFATDRFKRVHELIHHWYRGGWSDIYRDVPRVPRTGPAKTVNNRTSTPHTGAISGGAYRDDGTRMMRSILYARSVHGRAIHPTQKPLEVLMPLIQYVCPPGGVVLDPFAGSGATAEAAVLTGRRAVLVEGDERYCEAIAVRLSADALPVEFP